MLAVLLCAVLPQGAGAPVQDPKPLVATHFYYWYQWPKRNFNFDGTVPRAEHRHHFVEQEKVDYLDPDWYRGELRAMAEAGIDIALPVYWGRPGETRPEFAKAGLKPMVQALDSMAESGEGTVKLGLFYDTVTLYEEYLDRFPPDGRRDLTTQEGVDLFCETIISFFELVPERHWARMNRGALKGRPLVVLFSSASASAWNRDLAAAVRAAFEAAFPGEVPCIVADASWGDIGQDLTTAYGASSRGPMLFDHAPGRIHRTGGIAGRVAQIGPGFDGSLLPGNAMPVRDREGGAFYSWSWQQVLRARPSLVILETWNEMHEATEICETVETGRTYLDLTRLWTDRLVSGSDPGPEISLEHRELPPQRDEGWGEDAADSVAVRADFQADPVLRHGLREISCAGGEAEVRGGALRAEGRYLYFQVSDHWRFDTDAELEVELRRSPTGRVWLEYDSRDARDRTGGIHTPMLARERVVGREVIQETFLLPRARLANRLSCGADLRLVVLDGSVSVYSIVITALR